MATREGSGEEGTELTSKDAEQRPQPAVNGPLWPIPWACLRWMVTLGCSLGSLIIGATKRMLAELLVSRPESPSESVSVAESEQVAQTTAKKADKLISRLVLFELASYCENIISQSQLNTLR